MIKQFSFSNFLSFKDKTVLDFPDNNIITIFGPNANGKSNLFKAFLYFNNSVLTANAFNQNIPISNVKDVSSPLINNLSTFMLDKDSESNDSEFEIIFENDDIEYVYGFIISRKEKRIKKEYLYEKSLRENKNEERRTKRTIFIRDNQDFEYEKDNTELKQKAKNVEKSIREDILSIIWFANSNIKEAQDVLNFISSFNLVDFNDIKIFDAKVWEILEKDLEIKEQVLNTLSLLDNSIKDIKVIRPSEKEKEELKKNSQNFPQILPNLNYETLIGCKSLHNVYNPDGTVSADLKREFDLSLNESIGTQVLISTLTILFDIKKKQHKLLFIDDFGSYLHPYIVKEVIKIIKSIGVQIILISHNTGIINKEIGLKKESIWFVEKNNKEESELYSLKDIEGVRSDIEFEKNYLEGRFGGVPYIVETNNEN